MASANVSSTASNEAEGASSTASAASRTRPRSCVICARRKVSCDKNFPCGRCHRARVRCVQPETDDQPRWARRLAQGRAGVGSTPTANHVDAALLDRLHELETLVHDLRGELAQARSSSNAAEMQTSDQGSTNTSAAAQSTTDDSTPSGRPRDLSSAFWSHVDHELGDLREGNAQTDQGDYQPSSGVAVVAFEPTNASHLPGLNRASAAVATSNVFPLASQIPFLVDVYSERVHSVIAIPHLPSLKKLVRRGGVQVRRDYKPGEEAVLFAVFYAATCSLDEEEVRAAFNLYKSDLTAAYRHGLDAALAKADFFSNPNDDVLQALLVFMTLARLHENVRYLWMMTGLIIRMARFLRYDEDGADSAVTPFKAEIRRRVWWNLCALDMRATEDQGTALANPQGSFTTKLPSNVDDDDLDPAMQHAPAEHSGLTNVSLLRLCSKVARTTQQMMAGGSQATVQSHINLLDGLAQELDRDYFGISDQSQHESYLAAAGTMRVFLARLTLLAFLPTLCTAGDRPQELRDKLLIAALEIAELNHALNTDLRCQPWRWVYQTQQHWHAVVFILIEICRRPWSAFVERAWVALQSPWLLPARAASYRNPTVWVPLRSLTQKARSHRESELQRLRRDSAAAEMLAREDEQMPTPASSSTFPEYYDQQKFHLAWFQLVREDVGPASGVQASTNLAAGSVQGQHTASPSQGIPGFAPLQQATRNEQGVLASLDPALFDDSDAQYANVMDDLDLADFDWNSWFTSAFGSEQWILPR